MSSSSRVFQQQALQDRLQDAFRTVVGLHEIGEDRFPARQEHASYLGQQPATIAAVQHGVLGP